MEADVAKHAEILSRYSSATVEELQDLLFLDGEPRRYKDARKVLQFYGMCRFSMTHEWFMEAKEAMEEVSHNENGRFFLRPRRL